MSKEMYCQLIDSFCEKFGIADPEPMYKACNLRVNNTDLTLLHGDFIDQNCLIVYCDLGEPPADNKQLAIQRLMEVNLSSFAHGAPRFGRNPETGHLLLMQRLTLSETDVDTLMTSMAEFESFALVWRQNFLLMADEFANWRYKQFQEQFAASGGSESRLN